MNAGPPPRRDTRAQVNLALTCAFGLLLIAAGVSAYFTAGRAFPSVLVDPYSEYSVVHLPTWPDPPIGLRHPDAWVQASPGPEIVGNSGKHPFQQFAASWRGADQVRLTFRSPGGEANSYQMPVRKVAFGEIWVFFILYALTGAFVIASAMVVVRIAERPSARFAYVAWSTSIAAFLCSFYDYHTHGWLKPVFTCATVGMVAGPLLLALSFPTLPRKGEKLWKALLYGLLGAAALTCAAVILWQLLGRDPVWVRRTVTDLLAPTMGLLGVVVLVRFFRADERERKDLQAALWGLAAVPLMGGLVAGFTLWTGNDLLHLFLPVLVASFPLSIGYALVRRNIFAATAVLQRRALVGPVAVCGVLAATLAWVFVDLSMRRSDAAEVVPPIVAFGVFLVVVGWTWRFANRVLFPASRHFRPTVERLGDELGREREEERLRETLANVTRQWLPTRATRVVNLADVPGLPDVPDDVVEKLVRGERVWTLGSGWERGLLLPMRSLGEVRGVLHVAPKENYALYTDEDLALLETMASLGAIALHNANVLAELERLRKWQVDAARDEKRLTVGTIGAEISHELAYPLNFFRYLLRQSEHGVSAEDLEIGREEVERLERMLASLRKLNVPAPRIESVPVHATVRRALHLCRDLVQQKQIEVVVEVPENATVLADPDPLVQLFSNLLRNASQAVGERGKVGIRFAQDGASRTLEVWDNGPGIPTEIRETLFNPWVTTKAGGTGLGLAVTQRIVRSFGWTLTVDSVPGRTSFRVHVPPSSETGGGLRTEVA